jgi:hypothetical protein
MKMCSFEVWLLSSVAVPSTKTFLAVAAKVSREPSKKRDERGSDEEVCLIRLRCWDVLNKMCRGRLQGIHDDRGLSNGRPSRSHDSEGPTRERRDSRT